MRLAVIWIKVLAAIVRKDFPVCFMLRGFNVCYSKDITDTNISVI
jgi:hypothetical protein